MDTKEVRRIGYKTLTPFQKEILKEAKGRSCGLSLPMGSGKTRISLILGLYRGSKIPTLIVAAKNIIHEWIYEIENVFEGKARYSVIHSDYINVDEWNCSDEHFVLTTPEIVAKSYNDGGIFGAFYEFDEKYYIRPTTPFSNAQVGYWTIHSIKWSCLVVDEAQEYCNVQKSKRGAGLASISSDRRYLLSGTMLQEPKIDKVISYYLILNDPYFPRNRKDAIEFLNSNQFRGVKTSLVHRDTNVDCEDFELRRHYISHSLSEPEAKIYRGMKGILQKMGEEYNRYKDEENEDMRRLFSGFIVTMISHMRMAFICSILPIARTMLKTAGSKSKDGLAFVFEREIKKMDIDEWLDDESAAYSSRLKSMVEKLEEIEERSVVFASSRFGLNLLRQYIPEDREVFSMEGSYSLKKRAMTISKFKESERGVLLLSFQIGCNGLNLQSANNVLLMDYPWNSSIVDQAIARVARRGQKKDVNVYYFTGNTGMEKSLFHLHKDKKDVAAQIMDGIQGEWTVDTMKMEEILNIVNNTKENIRVLKAVNDSE